MHDHAKTNAMDITDGTQEGQQSAGEAGAGVGRGGEAHGQAAGGFRGDDCMEVEECPSGSEAASASHFGAVFEEEDKDRHRSRFG